MHTITETQHTEAVHIRAFMRSPLRIEQPSTFTASEADALSQYATQRGTSLLDMDPGIIADRLSIIRQDRLTTVDAGTPAAVETIKPGAFVRRNPTAAKTYTRGAYDRTERAYMLNDCDDISRCIWVRKGTALFTEFTY
jgi:hypothetical protein